MSRIFVRPNIHKRISKTHIQRLQHWALHIRAPPALDVIRKNNVNLFWIGANGGQGEYVQAATVTPVTPLTGYASAYTFSNLLRARFLTDYAPAAHGPDEFFVLIDTTVKPRRCELKELKAERHWVGASVGQGIAEAETVSALDFTLSGNSLKMPTVSNPRGARDTPGNLLVEFDGRNRKSGGLRSGAGGAVHEEEELYFVQILHDGSTTLPNGRTREMTVRPGTPHMAIMESVDSPGKFGAPGINSGSVQVITETDNICEGFPTFNTAIGSVSSGFGVVPASFDWRNATDAWIEEAVHIWIEFEHNTDYEWTVYEYGVPVYSYTSVTPVELRYRIAFSGSETRVCETRPDMPTKMIYSSPKPQTFPYRLVTILDGDTVVKDVYMSTRPSPKTVYSASQQVEDFGSVQASVEMDIWQHSPIVGAGQKKRVTL